MISAAVIETSVTITDNLQSQLLRSTFTWKIKLRGPKVLFCSNFAPFNTYHKKVDRVGFLKSPLYINVHVHAIKSICESFPVQNDLLIAFSLCHSSADHKQVAFVVRI